jgi:NADPH:quinone reductase-like Zn-dependent oxidoreductase
MKAAVMHQQGGPEVLKIEDWPMPAIKPNEVLVKVGAVGVSYHDVVERNGAYQRGVHFPMVIGNEVAGTVDKVGDLVTSLKPGDRVCCKPFQVCGMCRRCRNGMETACTKRRGVRGGYAEYVAITEEALVKVPDQVSLEEACMLGASTGVALNAVRDVARVKIGEHVLVTGASGGCGIPSVEIARASGCTVIAVTRSEAKRAELLDIGAHHVVVAPDGHDFSKDVLALTADEGVEVIIDNVGSRVFTPCFKSMAVGGRYAFVGQLFREDISINPARIFFKRANMLGVGSCRRDQLEDAIRLVAAGTVKPRVARVLPLAQVAEAHAMVERGDVVGRVVLKP